MDRSVGAICHRVDTKLRARADWRLAQPSPRGITSAMQFQRPGVNISRITTEISGEDACEERIFGLLKTSTIEVLRGNRQFQCTR